MALRRLLSLLIAFALGLAPLGMPAMASAGSAPHHQAMTGDDHCGGNPAKDVPAKSAGKDCCAAMCLGIPIPAGADETPHFAKLALHPAAQLFRDGIPTELPTPPPKSS